MIKFSAPDDRGHVKPGDLLGNLVAIQVVEFHRGRETNFGVKPALSLTIHDIDGEQTYENVLWFATAIVDSLKTCVGDMVLVRIAQGTARPGQQPPWILRNASDDPKAVRLAVEYLDSLKDAS